MRQSVIFIFAVLFSMIAGAGQDVISDDGREVRLKDDGSWEFISNDRYATTADGRRVRLKANGSWEYTGEKSTATERVASDQKYIDASDLEISITDLVIESSRGKKSQSHKNSRKKTHSVFYISLLADDDAEAPVELVFANGQVEVQDTDGREYPVIKIEPKKLSLQPGQEATLEIRTDGSPHWWTTKSMSVTFDKKLFGSRKDIVVMRDMSTAKKKEVDGF